MQFSERETGTLLAALRSYQSQLRNGTGYKVAVGDQLFDIASNSKSVAPLTLEEIDALCEAINTVPDTAPVETETVNPDLPVPRCVIRVQHDLIDTIYADQKIALTVLDDDIQDFRDMEEDLNIDFGDGQGVLVREKHPEVEIHPARVESILEQIPVDYNQR